MQNSRQPHLGGQILSGVLRRDAIEDMAGAVRSFFNLEAVQLEPGECRCQIDFIAAGTAFVYHEHYPLRTHLTGELLGNRFGLALPVRGPSIRFSGEEMDNCRLASAMTGEQMDVHAGPGLKQIVVLVDQSKLLALGEDIGLPRSVQEALSPGRSTMPLVAKPALVESLSLRVQDLLRSAAAGTLNVPQPDFEDWVYSEILSIVDVKDLPPGRPPAAVLVRRATELADANAGPLRMARLCAMLHVSPSTLTKAFKSVTGVNPHTFFMRRRLNQARSILLRADSEGEKVTSVASGLGFTELGRFAVRYRQMFGESPSQTLRRQTRRTVAAPAAREA